MKANRVAKRRTYLINKLFELDVKYLEFPLYSLPLAELERLHINELNKTEHVQRWKNS